MWRQTSARHGTAEASVLVAAVWLVGTTRNASIQSGASSSLICFDWFRNGAAGAGAGAGSNWSRCTIAAAAAAALMNARIHLEKLNQGRPCLSPFICSFCFCHSNIQYPPCTADVNDRIIFGDCIFEVSHLCVEKKKERVLLLLPKVLLQTRQPPDCFGWKVNEWLKKLVAGPLVRWLSLSLLFSSSLSCPARAMKIYFDTD